MIFFSKKKKKEISSNSTKQTPSEKNQNQKKYEIPLIFLIDCEKIIADSLNYLGYETAIGTLGPKYPVNLNNRCEVFFNPYLQYLEEYDIIIINNQQPDLIKDVNFEQKLEKKSKQEIWFSELGQNYFDPRPLLGNGLANSFRKILAKNGIIIVISNLLYTEIYHKGELINGQLYDSTIEEFKYSNWDFLPIRSQIYNLPSRKKMYFNREFTNLKKTLKNNADAFEPVVEFNIDSENEILLAEDKYENVLSKIYITNLENPYNCGKIIFLPRIINNKSIFKAIFNDMLPILSPNLFPHITKNLWFFEDEYRLPKINELIKEKKAVEEEYQKKIQEIEMKIQGEKESYNFLFGLLGADSYNKKLIENLIIYLQKIGFSDVIDFDEGKDYDLEEDIQLNYKGKLLLIEAKGISGLPTEDDCNQILKYILRRQKELNRTDIYGIFIVNHERLLPPFKRQINVFTDHEIEDSKLSSYALTSTWELFKAYKLFENGQLTTDDFFEAFISIGEIEFIPKGWNKLGRIEHIYNDINVARIIIESEELKVGDDIGYFNGIYFDSFCLESMQINKVNINNASKGSKPGIKFPGEIKEKYVLYKINKKKNTNKH